MAGANTNDDLIFTFHTRSCQSQGYEHSGYVGYGSCSGYGVIREEGQVLLKFPFILGKPLFKMCWFYMGIDQTALDPPPSVKRANVEEKSAPNHPGKPFHPRANVGKK